MRTPVPKLIRRPSRSTPSVLLALLLLTARGLGGWLAGARGRRGRGLPSASRLAAGHPSAMRAL